MAESNVTIKIDIDANTNGIDDVRAKLAGLALQAEAVDKQFNSIATNSSKLKKNFVDLDKEVRQKEEDFDGMGKSVDKSSKALKKHADDSKGLEKVLKGLQKGLMGVAKFGLKAVAISAAAAALSLVGVSAAFKLGAAMARGYHKVMAGVFHLFTTAGAAAITVLSLFAAGQREAAAATQASRYGGGVAGLNNSTAAMRSLTSNTRLAVLGTEALQGAFMGISKSTRMTGMLGQAVEAVGDFAAASSDPKKAMAAAGDFLGQLQKGGKLTSAIVASAADVGPEFEKAVKDAQTRGLNSAPEFLKALIGGDLSGDVAGQLDVVNNTLFGTAKRNFQMIKEQFADFGTPLLGTGTKVIGELARIVTRTFMSISGVVNGFAQGSASDKLINGVSKMGFWITKVFNEYLPKTSNIFQSIRKFTDRMRENFSSVVDKLRPLLVGGQVLLDTFGPVVSGFFKSFGGGVQDLNEVLVDNKEGLAGFFSSFMKLFDQFAKISGVIKKLFIEALPAIRPIIDGLTLIVKGLAAVIAGLSKASLGGLGSLAMLGAMGYGAFRFNQLGEKKTGQKSKGIVDKTKAALGPNKAGSPLTGTAGAASSLGVTNMTAATVNLYATNVTSMAGGGLGAGGGLNAGGGVGDEAYGPGAPDAPAQKLSKMQRAKNFAGSPMGLTVAALGSSYASQFLNQRGIGTGQGGLIGSAYFGARAMGVLEKGKFFGQGISKINGGAGISAAGATGVAIAGSMAGDLGSNVVLGSKYSKNLTSTQSDLVGTGSGALAGAAAGMAIGSVVPVIGTLVGGVVGGIAGGIAGFVNSGKYKEQARKQAGEFVAPYKENIDSALESGDVKGVKEQLAEMDKWHDAASANSKQTKEFTKEYEKQRKELEDRTGPALKAYDENVKMLSSSTGKSANQVKELADKLGINLMGTLKDVKNVISEITGLPEFKKTSDITSFALGQYADVTTKLFQGFVDKADTLEAAKQAGISIQQIGQEGGIVSDKELATFLATANQYQLSEGKNPAQAIGALYSALGPGGTMYSPESQFAGMEAAIGPRFQDMISRVLSGITTNKTEDGTTLTIQALVAQTIEGTGLDVGTATADFVKYFNSLKTPKEQIDAYAKLSQDAVTSLNRASTGFDPKILLQSGFEFSTNVSDTLKATYLRIREYLNIPPQYGPFLTPPPQYGPALPPPPQYGPFPITIDDVNGDGKPPDTSTPRRNMLATNRIHNAINNTISGKRTITSGYRTNNLGSINSDHMAGRALDITGQYLGSYATAMNDAGGFAEFHGAGGGRHLHVVPPENGPIGDTMSPLPSMSMGNAGNSYANSYSFNIASSPNASADQIAQAVMDRLHREQRSARERQ